LEDLPFLGRGIFGSGWQRQTCGGNSPDTVEAALRGVSMSMGLLASMVSSSLTTFCKEDSLFLVVRGDVTVDSSSSSFARCTGPDIDPDLESLILLLFRKLREGFKLSVGEFEGTSPTCMLLLRYLLGTLKNVAIGDGGREGEDRTIGDNTRVPSIFESNNEVAAKIKVFERRVHCPVNRKGMSDGPSSIPTFFESIMRER
jgi:hypothetical protein